MSGLRRFLWVPLVAAAILAVYVPGLANQPVFDDVFLTDGDLFTRFNHWQLRTRILSYGSFAWLHALFGDGWWKQRLVNLAIHMAVVAAMWAFYKEILRALTTPPPEPGEPQVPYHESPALGFAIGFFAINPVAVYAVNYLIQRSILMATLFVILGLWAFARGLRTRHWHWFVLAVAFYVAAFFSKEHSVLAPLAALPIYIVIARPPVRRLAIVGVVFVAVLAPAGLFLASRYGNILGNPFDEYSIAYLSQLAALDRDAPGRAYPLSVVNQAWLFFEYGFRWFIPVSDWMSIAMRPPFPLKIFTFPHVLGIVGYVAVLAGGFYMLVRYRDWKALVGLSFVIPALLFATEFATVWVQDPFVLYRSYLWAIGVPGIVFVLVNGTSPRALLVTGIIVGILFTWQAIERVLSLSTPEAAWSDAILKLPKDPRAVGRFFPYLNRGAVYADRDEYDLAIRDFEASSALGDLGMGAFNAGSMLSAKGKPQQALTLFDRAKAQGYNQYTLPFQKGLALAAVNRFADAYVEFEAALTMKPPENIRRVILLQMGRAGLLGGRRDDAIARLEELVAAEPAHKEARYLLAQAYMAKNEHVKAMQWIDKLERDDPSARIFLLRAMTYYGQNRKADAMNAIETAIRMGPDSPAMREWQARIRAMR